MQDIPRNELLDKLAGGWKCRRKSWSLQSYRLVLADSEFISPQALVANDWEGEPPEPVLSYKGVDIVTAFRHLKGGAAFIRRGFGEDEVEVNSCHTNVALTTEDILATDWEVWG